MWYVHKLYNINWQFLRTLSPTSVFNKVDIEWSIDSWFATYSFQIDKKYDDPLDNTEFLLTVEKYDEVNKSWWLLFSWSLDSIKWTIWNDENISEYRFWWLHRLLSEVLCPSSYTTYSNQKVKDLVQQAVNYFNTQYPIIWTFLSWSFFKNWVTDETLITRTTATASFTLLQYIQDVFKISWKHFFIKQDWTIIWWSKPSTATYRFNVQSEITKLEVDRVSIIWVKNRVIVWSNSFQDNWSISLYWKRETIQQIDTTDITTITNFANNYLSENSFWKREITIDVSLKDYSNIYPYQTVKILNTRLDSMDNLQIQKTKYNGETMTIYLEKYTSLPFLLKW
jgi:hypothetical protein